MEDEPELKNSDFRRELWWKVIKPSIFEIKNHKVEKQEKPKKIIGNPRIGFRA